MSIILAENAGFCFGVKRAVDEALKTVKKYNHKVYTLGPLIHNNDVVEYLKENGIFEIEFDHIDELNKGDVIIIRSHGVSRDILDKLLEKGLNIVDATCPYVSNIQKKVKKYYTEGYKIIIVGDSAHPEVMGINGWCDYSALISKHGENLENLPHKVCIVSQTTEKEENWENVLNVIIKNCKEFIAFNTICSATSVRQKSARELSENVDLMVVLGGKHSSNTNKLYEICRGNCRNTILVENAGEIPEKILKSKTIKKIGVTAGASTPEWIIKEAILKMNNFENLEMNEQLEYMNNNEVQVRIGEKIKGTVLSVNENEVFMNIGYKVDAVLPKAEITKDETVKLSDHFNAGDTVEAKVLKIRNEDGYVVLSRLVMERDEAYKFLSQAYADGTPVTVIIKEVVNGGLVAGYKGIRIFIPASHVELFHVDNLENYLNKELEIKIIEYGQERKTTKIVGSRRELLKIEKSKKEEEAWQSLHVGDVIEGEVKRLTDFGAFVDVKGVDGLLHVSEISWGRLNRPADVLKVGDMVKASIIDLDPEKKKISLSMKALTEDPWNNVDVKYPVDSIVLGKVARFAKFGAFVELEPGIDALVHISQISHKKINKPSDVLEIGQQIKAKILDVNKENKRVALSIKEAEEI